MQQHSMKQKSRHQRSAAQPTAKSPVSRRSSTEPSLQLQQTIGNHGVLRRSSDVIQAKLKIGPANDKYEREADRVADLVMRMPAPKLLQEKQRSIGGTTESDECAACRNKKLSLQALSKTQTGLPFAPPIVGDVLRSPGKPLDASTRAFMEPRFGYDFSQVRMHTDPKAAESARAVNAAAFTAGEHVVMGEAYSTFHKASNRSLLAHELVHVLQQGGGTSSAIRLQQAHPNAVPGGLKALAIAMGELNKKVEEDPPCTNRGRIVDNYTRMRTPYKPGKNCGPSWCALFVRWCLQQAGVSNPGINDWAATVTHFSLYKKRSERDPRAGDIFFMTSSAPAGTQHACNQSPCSPRSSSAGSGHIGFIWLVYPDGKHVKTVEGNAHLDNPYAHNDGVESKKRKIEEFEGFLRLP